MTDRPRYLPVPESTGAADRRGTLVICDGRLDRATKRRLADAAHLAGLDLNAWAADVLLAAALPTEQHTIAASSTDSRADPSYWAAAFGLRALTT